MRQTEIVKRALHELVESSPTNPIPLVQNRVLDPLAPVMRVDNQKPLVPARRGHRAENTFRGGVPVSAHHDGRTELGEVVFEGLEMIDQLSPGGHVDNFGRDVVNAVYDEANLE